MRASPGAGLHASRRTWTPGYGPTTRRCYRLAANCSWDTRSSTMRSSSTRRGRTHRHLASRLQLSTYTSYSSCLCTRKACERPLRSSDLASMQATISDLTPCDALHYVGTRVD
eukprot:scaffold679_cov374-Prasinococcus_capsulatus_cf.AAC.16